MYVLTMLLIPVEHFIACCNRNGRSLLIGSECLDCCHPVAERLRQHEYDQQLQNVDSLRDLLCGLL